MSGWTDPVGPKPKSVYVRRRIFVLLGLLAVIAAIVLIIVKPGSSTEAAPASTVEIPEGVSGTNASEAPDEAADEATSDTPEECRAQDLEVVPLTDRESYAAGEEPELSLSVENTGTRACIADLGTAGMVFTVTSGSDQVWLSTDCQKQADHRDVILEPGKKLRTEPLIWDRTRSTPDTCTSDREPVGADGASYHLSVAAGGAESRRSAQFLLY